MIEIDKVSILQRGEKWPPKSHENRIARYKKNKQLFLGNHDAVYLEHLMERMDVDYRENMIQIAANFAGAVSKLYSDLLFGEEPNYNAKDNEDGQMWIDEFRKNNGINNKNYKAGLAQSYRGDTIYKLTLKDRQAQVSVIPAKYWFPITSSNNINKIEAHIIAYTEKIDKKQKKLYVEMHQAGRIDYRQYLVKNKKIKREFTDARNTEQTGVDKPLVFHVPNMQIDDRLYGVDDYSEADTLFAELDTRLSQIAKILDKHSDPNMYGPAKNSQLDPRTGEEQVDVGGSYFEVEAGEEPPSYMTWDARLDANFKFIDKIMQMLYIVTDTNAAAFSLFESGSIPSGSAMRRLLMRSIARTSRKRLPFDDVLPELIQTANELERVNGRDVAEVDNIEISWNDGLPDDPVEQANIMQVRTGGQATISQRRATKELDGLDQEALDEEMQRIKEDKVRQAPPSPAPAVFGETGEGE